MWFYIKLVPFQIYTMELFSTLSNRLKFFSSWTMFIKIIEMVKFERLSRKIWIKGLKTTVLTKTTNDSILKKIENGITSLHSKTIEQSKFHNIYIYMYWQFYFDFRLQCRRKVVSGDRIGSKKHRHVEQPCALCL